MRRPWPPAPARRGLRPAGPAGGGTSRTPPPSPARSRAVPASTASRTSSASAPLAGVDDANERADEVVVGGDDVEVDAGAPNGVPHGGLLRGAGGAQPVAEHRVAGVDHQLLAGLRVLDDDEAGV